MHIQQTKSNLCQSGFSSVLSGGTFVDGVRNGLISAGLNHGFHMGWNAAEGPGDGKTWLSKSIGMPKKVGETAVVEFGIYADGNIITPDGAELIFQIPVIAKQSNTNDKLYWFPYDGVKAIQPYNGNFSASVSTNAANFHDYSFEFIYAESASSGHTFSGQANGEVAGGSYSYTMNVKSDWYVTGSFMIQNSNNGIAIGYSDMA